jgi:hypothetical protein
MESFADEGCGIIAAVSETKLRGPVVTIEVDIPL